MGYNFRVPESMGIEDTTFITANQTFNLVPTVEGAKVHYTLDGYTPTQNDLWSSGNLEVAVPKGKKMQVQTIVITPMGKRSNIVKATLQND
jgi:hexosaminidase